MCPVHSTGRRCAASAFNVSCPLRWRAATRPSCRRRACLFRWQAVRSCCGVHYAHHHPRVTEEAARDTNTMCATNIMALRDLLGDTGIGYFYMYSLRFAPGPTCRGSVPLYVPPLWAIKGRAHDVTDSDPTEAQAHLDSRAHMFIQALKPNTSHSGVGYYAPAARTTLNPCVFLCTSRLHLTGKTLRPLLILGFRAGAFRHPAGEFPLRQFLCSYRQILFSWCRIYKYS
jgi:hypothetical protein